MRQYRHQSSLHTVNNTKTLWPDRQQLIKPCASRSTVAVSKVVVFTEAKPKSSSCSMKVDSMLHIITSYPLLLLSFGIRPQRWPGKAHGLLRPCLSVSSRYSGAFAICAKSPGRHVPKEVQCVWLDTLCLRSLTVWLLQLMLMCCQIESNCDCLVDNAHHRRSKMWQWPRKYGAQTAWPFLYWTEWGSGQDRPMVR